MTGLYMRLSLADRDLGERKDESNSIENQRLLLMDFLNGRSDLDRHVKEYIDDGYTGTNFDRPAFKQLIEDVKNGIIQLILIKDLSRLGRDYIGVGDYLEQIFPMLGVRLIAVTSNYDSKHYGSKAMDLDIPIQNMVNYFYSRDISVKTRSALKTRWETGRPTGSRPPYGYMRDPVDHLRWVPDPNTAPIVQKIFELAAQGCVVKEIAEYLNAKQILPPGKYREVNGTYAASPYRVAEEEKKWNTLIVRSILQRYSYTGAVVHGQRQKVAPCACATRKVPKSQQIISENVNPAIISQEQFQAAQKAIRKQERKTFQEDHLHPLRGKLRCGNCNLAMQISVEDGKRSVYCYHAAITGDSSQCCRDFYSLDAMEQAVCTVLRGKLSALMDIRDRIVEKNTKTLLGYDRERRQLEGRMEAIKAARVGLYRSYAEDFLSKEAFQKQRQDLCMELEECEKRAAFLISRSGSIRACNARLESYANAGRMLAEEPILTQQIVDSCIDTVYVYDPQHMEVRVTFEDILASAGGEW